MVSLDEWTEMPEKKTKPGDGLKLESRNTAAKKGLDALMIPAGDVEEKKNVQISMKLDEKHSRMIAEVREWIQEKRIWSLYGEKFFRPDADTDTTLARTLLHFGLEAMQREIELDKLVTKAAELWAHPGWESDEFNREEATTDNVIKRWKGSSDYRSLPSDVLNYVIEKGCERAMEANVKRIEDIEREMYGVTNEQLKMHLAYREPKHQ